MRPLTKTVAEVTRRTFINTGVKATGAAVALGTVGTVASGVIFPGSTDAVTFPESRCVNEAGRKILVAYASKFGTTGEVAVAVAQTLCEAGATVDVLRIADVQNVGDYDAVVIGAAIQYDDWMSEARALVAANEDVLSTRPVAYFFTCMVLSRNSAKAKKKALGYADKLATLSNRVSPVTIGQFAGVVDYDRMNLRTKLAVRIIFTVMGVSEGDYRDWDAIGAWGTSLSELTG